MQDFIEVAPKDLMGELPAAMVDAEGSMKLWPVPQAVSPWEQGSLAPNAIWCICSSPTTDLASTVALSHFCLAPEWLQDINHTLQGLLYLKKKSLDFASDHK